MSDITALHFLMRNLLITLLTFAFTSRIVVYCSPAESRLLRDLLQDYDPRSRPVLNDREVVRVNISFTLMKLMELTDRDQTISVNGFFWMQWYDRFLRWSPAHYNNITSVIIPSSEMWMPDVVVRDSKNNPYEIMQDRTFGKMQVFSDGSVSFFPTGEMSLLCPLDIRYRYFPYDKHICAITLGAWMLTTDKQQLQPAAAVSLRRIAAHIQWRITEHSTVRYCFVYDKDEYDMIRIFFKLERKSKYYLVNFIVPCILLGIISLCDFIVPLDHGGRINTSMVVLLTYVVFQLVLFGIMPQSSDSIPYISTLIFLQMGLLVIAIVVDSILQWMKRKDPLNDDKFETIPGGKVSFRSIWDFCLFCCFKETSKTEESEKIRFCCCLNSPNRTQTIDVAENGKIGDAEKGASSKQDNKGDGGNDDRTWFHLALIVDRFFFWFFAGALAICNIVVYSIMVGQPNDQHVPSYGKCPGFQWKTVEQLDETFPILTD